MNSKNNTPLKPKNTSNLENIEYSNNPVPFSVNENENFKHEINNLENSLYLNSFPSFSDLFSFLLTSNNTPLLRTLLSSVNRILIIKNDDNGKKMDFIQKIQRLESDRQNMEKEINKLKGNINEISDKLKRNEFAFEEKKRESEIEIKKIKYDLNEEQKDIQKWKTKFLNLEYELSKNRKLYEMQNEHLLKIQINAKGTSFTASKNDMLKFSSISGRADMDIKYVLDNRNFTNYGQNNNSISSNNIMFNSNPNSNSNIFNSNSNPNPNQNPNSNSNSNAFFPKIEFQRSLQNNIEDKYKNIVNDNERMKGFLIELHLKFVKLVNMKKEVFLNYYKRTFGIDFPNEDRLFLDAETNYTNCSNAVNLNNFNPFKTKLNFNSIDISLDIEYFIMTFNNNFIRLEEYLIKNQELGYINNDFDKGSQSINRDKDSFINDKYISNLILLFEKYKSINKNMSNLVNVNTMLKRIKYDNIVNEVVSRFENTNINLDIKKEILYYENIKEIINENNAIINNFSEKIRIDNLDNSNVGNISNISNVSQMQIKNFNIDNYEAESIRLKENEKSNMQNFIKFNNSLREEISGYEKILNSTLDYCSKISSN